MPRVFAALLTAIWLAPVAHAEEITLTTYYPSPRGVYKELRAEVIEANNGSEFSFKLNEGTVVAEELQLIDKESGEIFGLQIEDRRLYVVDYESEVRFLLMEFPEDGERIDSDDRGDRRRRR